MARGDPLLGVGSREDALGAAGRPNGREQCVVARRPGIEAHVDHLATLEPRRLGGDGSGQRAETGLILGLLMQLACMYLPEHALTHHVAPVAVLAALGAVLGPLVLRRI